MNYYKCSVEECQYRADIRCSCMAYLCKNHENCHLDGKMHHSLDLQAEINTQTQSESINYLQREIEKLRYLKRNLIREVYTNIVKIESSLELFCSKIDNDIEEMKIYANEILGFDRIPTNHENYEFNWLKGNYEEGIRFLEQRFRDSIKADQVEIIVYDIFYKEFDNNKGINRIELSKLEEKTKTLESEISDLRKCYENLQFEYKEQTEKYEKEKEFLQMHGGPSVRCCLCHRFFYDDQLAIHDCGCVSCKNCKLPENRTIEDIDSNCLKVFCWVCGKFKDNENNWICLEEKFKKAY